MRRVVQNDDGDGDGDFGKGKGGRFFVGWEIEIARRRDNAARRSAVALFDDDDDDDDDDEHRVETTKGGVTRLVYTDDDARAREYVKNLSMQKNGLTVREDAMGTIFGRLSAERGRKRNETRKRRGIWIAHGRDSFGEYERSLWRFRHC